MKQKPKGSRPQKAATIPAWTCPKCGTTHPITVDSCCRPTDKQPWVPLPIPWTPPLVPTCDPRDRPVPMWWQHRTHPFIDGPSWRDGPNCH